MMSLDVVELAEELVGFFKSAGLHDVIVLNQRQGDFGNLVDIEISEGGKSAIMSFWSEGLNGTGMITYILLDDGEDGVENWMQIEKDASKTAEEIASSLIRKMM